MVQHRPKGNVLVTGGAGYIGSHIVRRLQEEGESLVVLDDLSRGHRAAVGSATLVEADFADEGALASLLDDTSWIIHMAASSEVGESMIRPAEYYANNLAKSLRLLDAAVRSGVRGIVLSSTAAVYGEPQTALISESHPQHPTNPYGETKLALERAMAWYHAAYGLRCVSLRYFNAAGAHPSGEIGEDHAPETHLIPLLIRAATREGETASIFGDDYPTRDGTCVRDFVHVVDLAEAHVLALDAMRRGAVDRAALNLGNGEGFTVREVVEFVRRVSGRPLPTRVSPRRAGDPAALVASSGRAQALLGWTPRYTSLEPIVRTAWRWHRDHPCGYGERKSVVGSDPQGPGERAH